MATNQFDAPLFSERCVSAVRKQGLSGVEFWPVEFRFIASTHLHKAMRGQYFWIKPTGVMRAKLTLDDGADLKDIDPITGRLLHEAHAIKKARFDTFEGEKNDFFYLENICTSTIFCSERVRAIAKKQAWSNVDFAPPAQDKLGFFSMFSASQRRMPRLHKSAHSSMTLCAEMWI